MFVASTGNDVNDCSRPSPCRTLQRGVDVVDPTGISWSTSGGTLTVENCVINGFTGFGGGIRINTGLSNVYVKDTPSAGTMASGSR